ncbi:sodium:solute symporter family protein [Aneurinibacillus sp. Ricciae_BoGa-3]|uniref:sodium:solute symporter family protein n=1 Tax=Aneurinibacillus sp. Ricciae_BoGa-3 TaxID=3022697 RepID=UPI0023420C2C|nr:sodium:solute symporter family protein [Aneurinibacillus sp. Ricciae_BoGa-3]WCK54153.1 sodium:solute symporter family protein [Aneurinibacillus sp. Ricciae_BoGa-3]
MTSIGYWFVGFALAYTILLISIGRIARKRAGSGKGYFVGGRNFSSFFVTVCITGLFSGSSYISIIELSYLKGVSAIWYGVAETLQVLLIATLLLASFRKKLVVTISGLIGDHFGRKSRALAGVITAFSFPMWSVATALAFASALHVFTGVSLLSAVAITAILLFAYLQFGGMWAIGYTQFLNTIVFYIMLIVGFTAVFIYPGVEGLKQFALAKPQMFSFSSVGIQTIVAWFGTFIVNVILAQAAFQMALSCRTPEEGKKGLLWAAVLGIPLIIGAVVFGLAAASVIPGETLGLVAIPHYLMRVLPAPFVALFFLGFWACALSWGAPCQFSGATSLGKDVGEAAFPGRSEDTYIRYTKWSLALLTVFMVIFASLRAEQSAWWNVLAWVARNSATFAPVVAALFWPLATSRAVLSSMVVGTCAGLLWYHLGGWQVNQFFLQVHPVWPGMIANIMTLMIVTLAENASCITWRANVAYARVGVLYIGVSLLTTLISIFNFAWLYQKGLFGLCLFIIVVGLFAATMIFAKQKHQARRTEGKEKAEAVS